MDEDAIPPIPVCSAPPLSEPPSLLLPLSSITPSFAKDGQSGHRRSGRIQEIRARTPKKLDYTDIQDAEKLCGPNLSSTKRQRESTNMVQASQSKLQRVERTGIYENPNKVGFSTSFTAEHQNKLKSSKNSERETNVSPLEDVFEPLMEPRLQNPDPPEPDMDACEDLPVGDLSEDMRLSKGWVIAPFFQSLKSKMASFTEIVMTPVKLFRASSPPPTVDEELGANDAAEVGDSKKSNKYHSEAQIQCSQQSLVDSVETKVAPEYSKRLLFDDSISRTERDFASAISGKDENLPDVVPLVDSSLKCVASEQVSKPSGSAVPLRPSATVSASNESNLNIYAGVDDQKCRLSCVKPLFRQDIRDGYEAVGADSNQPIRLQLDADEAANVETCSLVLQNLGTNTNKRPLTPSLDAEQMECQRISEMCSVSKSEQAKRGLKPNSIPQVPLKRKKVNTNSHDDIEKGPKVTRKRGALMHTITDEDERMKTESKRRSVSTRTTTKGKSEQGGMVCKTLQPRTALSKLEASSENNMDVETTVPTPPAGEPDKKRLSVVLIRSDVKELQRSAKRGTANKKQLKRKSPNSASSGAESESSLVSTSSCVRLKPMNRDIGPSLSDQGGDPSAREASQPSTRLKNSLRSAVKFTTQEKIKENLVKNGAVKISAAVFLEMTPSENNPLFLQPSSQIPSLCSGQSHKDDHLVTEKRSSASAAGETHVNVSEISSCTSRPSIRHVNSRQRSRVNQRRRCRVLHSRMCKTEEESRSITVEDADLAASRLRSSETSFSRQLLRSYSCPDVLILHADDSPWISSPHSPHHRTHSSHIHWHHHHGHLNSHSPRTLKRARRHTVCSVEVEREIAPLCLRKEVYPSRRSASYDSTAHHLSPAHTHSPCSSLTALASLFLSSPLAFLSKKSDCRGSPANGGTSSHVPSPPNSSTPWPCPSFDPGSNSAAALDPCSSGNPTAYETERRQQSEEEEDDGGDTSSSSQEFEDAGLREEKALSDSEIKVVKKHEEQKKVSSIRIRKTLPKPQTNLTPMGLPKPIRVKKKEFSLEEIYTNKNFSKPPESRLETIFEVPLNRKNGSESWCGPRRVKRFLEFLEVGEVRKPKKPLVGVGKGSPSSSRPRRGGFPKDEPSLAAQDVDSLLCSKLEELNLWLKIDQSDS